ncbi:MAG: hypothetical protein AB1546_10240 [bacterium]
MKLKKQPRLSISITEELMKKLDEFRDVINISEICRQALSNVVDTLWRSKMKVAETKEETIKRLKKEAEEMTVFDYTQGISIGYENASIMSLQDITETAQRLVFFDSPENFESILAPHYGEIKDYYFFDYVGGGYEISAEYGSIPLGTLNYEAFVKGWFEGIRHFWDEIKNEVLEPIIKVDYLEKLGETQDALKILNKVKDKDVKSENGDKLNNSNQTTSLSLTQNPDSVEVDSKEKHKRSSKGG